MKRRLAALAFCLTTAIVAMGCNPFFFLPPFHEGPHRIQQTTAADIQRGVTLAACLQSWARANGHQSADYSAVDFTKLVIVRVGGDGVIGRYNGTTFQTDERQDGDSLFINEGVSGETFVALERHALVHDVQQYHPELIGANGDIHWAPPWDTCRVPRVIEGS